MNIFVGLVFIMLAITLSVGFYLYDKKYTKEINELFSKLSEPTEPVKLQRYLEERSKSAENEYKWLDSNPDSASTIFPETKAVIKDHLSYRVAQEPFRDELDETPLCPRCHIPIREDLGNYCYICGQMIRK